MLKRVAALFFVLSLFTHFQVATAFGQSDRPALEQLQRAAEQSLPLAARSENLSHAQARRLVRACFELAQLSPEDHEQVCVGNEALLASVQALGANKAALTADERLALQFYRSASAATADASFNPPSQKTIPPALAAASVKERGAVAKALAAEITRISMEYRLASVRGSLSRRIEVEAQLRTLHADLKKALGSNSHLLPSDPHALVSSKDVLASSLNSYKAEQRYFDYFMALVNNADVQTTYDTLGEEIQRLEALIDSDQPGQFHRARGEIEAAIDIDEWRSLSLTRGQRVAAERVRVEQEWRARYPTVIIPKNTTLSPPAGRAYWSELALKAIRSYALDPTEWAAAESELLASYSRIQQRGGTTKSYVEWVSSLMTPSDLESAILYTKAIETHGGYLQAELGELDPNAAHRRYYAEMSKSLQGEWFMRREGLTPARPPLQTPPDADMLKLRELYSVRLLKERYGDLSYMPPALKDKVRSATTQFSNEDFARALREYETFTELSDRAALSNRPLEARQLNSLAKARNDVLQTFLRADEIFEERIQARVLEPNPNTRKTKAIIVTLRAGRPPNDFGPLTSGRPPSPPDAPTALISAPEPRPPLTPRGKRAPSLELTDAHFNSALNNARKSLQELRGSLSKVQTAPEVVGASQGRLTVKEDNVWRGDLDYSRQPLSSAETRLPKSLQTWRGLINPATNKPYIFKTDVKVFRTFDAVGGGIHFGDDASLRIPANLSEFVLTFDEQAQTLVLQGSGNKKYLYGPVSPHELKALYRFARSEQNSAISVGWAGPQDVPEDRDSEGGSPVLLDPAFVDTPVGQTLFEADSIPWKLDRDLPGGVQHPFSDDFKKAYSEYTTQSVNLLLPLFGSVVKFEDRPTAFWQSVFNSGNTTDNLLLAVVYTDDLQQAKVEYLRITKAAEVAPLLNKPGIPAKERQKIKKYLDSVAWWVERLDTLRASGVSRMDVLLGLSSVMVSNSSVDTKWVTLWAALVKSRQPALSAEQLARYFLYELPNTTLAVLIDEPTTILLSGDQLILRGDMRYRYATSEILITPERVLIGRSLPQGMNQVRELGELTQLANSALPKLATLYQPLERTMRYARIVSFLRWSRGKGRLLAVDFSSLAAYPASDRVQTPTPDAVIRR
jgi:hypothetical protein